MDLTANKSLKPTTQLSIEMVDVALTEPQIIQREIDIEKADKKHKPTITVTDFEKWCPRNLNITLSPFLIIYIGDIVTGILYFKKVYSIWIILCGIIGIISYIALLHNSNCKIFWQMLLAWKIVFVIYGIVTLSIVKFNDYMIMLCFSIFSEFVTTILPIHMISKINTNKNNNNENDDVIDDMLDDNYINFVLFDELMECIFTLFELLFKLLEIILRAIGGICEIFADCECDCDCDDD